MNSTIVSKFRKHFPMSGRLNRAKFWKQWLISVLVFSAFVTLLNTMSKNTVGNHIVPLILNAGWIISLIIYSYVQTSLWIRRIHDRGNGAEVYWWWFSTSLLGAFLSSSYAKLHFGSDSGINLFGSLCSMASALLLFYMLIFYGFFRGQKGTNKYGTDPLQNQFEGDRSTVANLLDYIKQSLLIKVGIICMILFYFTVIRFHDLQASQLDSQISLFTFTSYILCGLNIWGIYWAYKEGFSRYLLPFAYFVFAVFFNPIFKLFPVFKNIVPGQDFDVGEISDPFFLRPFTTTDSYNLQLFTEIGWIMFACIAFHCWLEYRLMREKKN